MSAPLSDRQFAKYSAVEVARPDGLYDDVPRPAELERHAPGEYQPTLPGMERMLAGEKTHTSVFFGKRGNKVDEDLGDVRHSTIFSQRDAGVKPSHDDIQIGHLHPTQNWIDESYIHTPHDSQNGGRIASLPETTPGAQKAKMVRWGLETGSDPVVEKVPNAGNVIHDGHHRVVREMLKGKKAVRVNRWETKW